MSRNTAIQFMVFNMGRPQLVFLSMLLILSVPGTDLDAATIRVPGDFGSIQEAVDRAAPADVVIVEEGEYRENVVIKKPVDLRGAGGAGATVVEAAREEEPVFRMEDTENVSLTGFTARGSKVAGIVLRNVRSSRLGNNRAVENTNGIMVYSSHDNTLFNNNADSNEVYGIYMEKSTANRVRENTANRNGDKGIFLSSSHGNTITDNSANLNTWNGILVWSSNENLIRDNWTLRNTYGLVVGESRDNEMEDNTSLPNIFIIMPILLIYTGAVVYLIQKMIVRRLHGG